MRSFRGELKWCMTHNSEAMTATSCLWDSYMGNRPGRGECEWTRALVDWTELSGRRPTIEEWREIRQVYRYEGARIWWVSKNGLLAGYRPCTSSKEDVMRVIGMLSDGAFA